MDFARLYLGALFALWAPIACAPRSPAPEAPHTNGASPRATATSSRAYKGHQSDKDVNALVGVYPSIRGTRLDDCQTCHAGRDKNPCDYCHLVNHPTHGSKQPQPRVFADTLNPFGRDYARSGRSPAALEAIAALDSDGDGFSNQAEIAARKYPGDAQSKPGQRAAPMKVLSWEQIQAMPKTTELVLANLSKHRDYYATYAGVRIRDLIAAAGANPADPAIQGITVIAPDGYMKDFPVEKFNHAYPSAVFYGGLDVKTLGPQCGFVLYPNMLPQGVMDGASIPGEPWVILAYERDGQPLDPSTLDIQSAKIAGEGPYRIVVPQARPSKPDRGSAQSPSECSDGNDFDAGKDHNAGEMVRGVVAIRINPMPSGVEDFDSKNGGWAYVGEATLILYGYGIR
jgi:hypothetical protein